MAASLRRSLTVLLLLTATGCHAREARMMESERSGCPRSSVDVGDSCEEGYWEVENHCSGVTYDYACELSWSRNLSDCMRAVPCCKYPPAALPPGCR